MARTNKTGIDYFPVCNPHWITLERTGNIDRKKKYSAYRNISSGFIARKDVREIILKEYDYKCVQCGSKEKLQIDHIISVYSFFKTNMSIDDLNAKDNLQVLCKSCNSSKNP